MFKALASHIARRLAERRMSLLVGWDLEGPWNCAPQGLHSGALFHASDPFWPILLTYGQRRERNRENRYNQGQ
jgi:hypothetical protein